MIELNTIVEAIVDEVRSYCVLLHAKNERIVVPLDQIAWNPTPESSLSLQPGLLVRVKIISHRGDENAGSIRLANVEANPYAELTAVNNQGRVYEGKVRLLHAEGATLEILPGCYGVIRRSDLSELGAVTVGQIIPVTVQAVEIDTQQVALQPSSATNRARSG
jgi:ribosomal protein S1